MINSKGLSFASQFELKKLSITAASSNKSYELQNQYQELSLYEDIFSNTIYGTILIADSIDLLSNMPIIGEELVEIELLTPTMTKDIVKYKGYVYKVTDVVDTADKGKTYLIHFTSIETILDANKKISKYFNGQISTIIDNIFHDANLLGSDKKLVVEETANQIKFASPFWSPLKTINHLASMSLTKKSKIPSYVFFETLRGDFNFVSINNLAAHEPKITYRKNTGHTRDTRNDGSIRNLDNEYSIIQTYYIDEMFDYLSRLKNGMYASRLITANPISKTIKVTSQDYLNEFPKSNHLNKFPVMSSTAQRKKNASLNFVTNQEYSYDGQRNLRIDEWLLQRRSLLSQIHDVFRVDIEVNGRTDVHAGDTVNIEMMKAETSIKGDSNKQSQNNFYTGKFIVAAVHHRFADNRHTMCMQCVTDSFAKAL